MRTYSNFIKSAFIPSVSFVFNKIPNSYWLNTKSPVFSFNKVISQTTSNQGPKRVRIGNVSNINFRQDE